MYDGTIFIGGEPHKPRRRRGVGGDDRSRSQVARAQARRYELLPKEGVGHFRKIVAGKQLWNYDNLEPTEKKLVL